MTLQRIFIIILLLTLMLGCGKVGPLSLPEAKLDKSVISYPCNEECEQRFEEEKIRQQSVILQTD